MPVLVTGAEHPLARSTVRALAPLRGGEIRVYLPGPAGGVPEPSTAPDPVADPYRRLGCKIARGALDDEGRLELALAQVHTVVHVDAGPLERPDDLVDGVADVLSAAIGAGCRRVVWPSALGAGPTAAGDYLVACTEAEELLAAAPLQTVVVRRSLTYAADDPLTSALASAVPAEVAPARHAPLYVDDLGAALAGSDRARGTAGESHVVLTVAGPEIVSLERFSRLLAGVDGRRATALPAPAVEYLGRDALPGPDAIGRQGTPPGQGAALLRAGYG